MSHKISFIKDVLSGYQFDLSNEKLVHSQMKDVFVQNNISYAYEKRLSSDDIVDFIIDGIAVEVKIKGQATAIYRQCKRYLEHDEIKSLLLITNRTMGFPETINGKSCYVLTLGTSWL